jgi:alpha-tubulin suppressor-like RCC1 family protein
MTRFSWKYLAVALLALLTAACGGGSGSSAPTAIPSSATVFYSHALAFRNATTLMSWGYNGFGQLGRGGNDFANSSVPVPVVADASGATLLNLKDFATGGVHSVAFFNNSTARSWGSNTLGQLGNGSTNTSSKFAVPVFESISTTNTPNRKLRSVTAVAAGGFHSVALKGDGTVWTWGSNATKQLGIQDTPTVVAASRLAVPVFDAVNGTVLTNVRAVAAGGSHTLVLKNDGTVWAWGSNANGQLGKDPKDLVNPILQSNVPLQVAGLPAGITAIAAAGSYNLALDPAGNVWAWGYNGFGQLGNATTVDSFTPVLVQKAGATSDAPPVPLGVVIVKIAAGLDHALAIDLNGNVWAWGFNGLGQLGNSTTITKKDSATAVQVIAETSTATSTPPFTPFTGAEEIRAFGHSSMVRKGSIWYAWGDNTFGQLGINNTTNQSFPVKVIGF